MITGSTSNSSYQDDYLRRKGANRTLADPPSLLTDRGAYVNFLEVQLERVSAACLGVQGYEDRFNDMQGLIVSLEQRCASMTRLVSLAQQCNEEIRLEASQRIEDLSRQLKEEKASSQKQIETLNYKVLHLEKQTAVLPSIMAKLKTSERQSQAVADEAIRQEAKRANEHELLLNRVTALEQAKADTTEALDSMRTQVSKSTFEIEENNRRTTAFVNNFEDRLEASLENQKDDLAHKIATVDARHKNSSESLKKMMDNREADMMAIIRKHNGELHEELSVYQSRLAKDTDSKLSSFFEESKEEQSALRKNVQSKVDFLEKQNTEQAKDMLSLEEELLTQFTQYNKTFDELSSNQVELEKAQQETKGWTEKKLNDLFTSTRDLLNVQEQKRNERDFVLTRQVMQQMQQATAGALTGAAGAEGAAGAAEDIAASILANNFAQQLGKDGAPISSTVQQVPSYYQQPPAPPHSHSQIHGHDQQDTPTYPTSFVDGSLPEAQPHHASKLKFSSITQDNPHARWSSQAQQQQQHQSHFGYSSSDGVVGGASNSGGGGRDRRSTRVREYGSRSSNNNNDEKQQRHSRRHYSDSDGDSDDNDDGYGRSSSGSPVHHRYSSHRDHRHHHHPSHAYNHSSEEERDGKDKDRHEGQRRDHSRAAGFTANGNNIKLSKNHSSSSSSDKRKAVYRSSCNGGVSAGGKDRGRARARGGKGLPTMSSSAGNSKNIRARRGNNRRTYDKYDEDYDMDGRYARHPGTAASRSRSQSRSNNSSRSCSPSSAGTGCRLNSAGSFCSGATGATSISDNRRSRSPMNFAITGSRFSYPTSSSNTRHKQQMEGDKEVNPNSGVASGGLPGLRSAWLRDPSPGGIRPSSSEAGAGAGAGAGGAEVSGGVSAQKRDVSPTSLTRVVVPKGNIGISTDGDVNSKTVGLQQHRQRQRDEDNKLIVASKAADHIKHNIKSYLSAKNNATFNDAATATVSAFAESKYSENNADNMSIISSTSTTVTPQPGSGGNGGVAVAAAAAGPRVTNPQTKAGGISQRASDIKDKAWFDFLQQTATRRAAASGQQR